MERIVLEVDNTVGNIYNNLSAESKQQFNQTVSLMVKKIRLIKLLSLNILNS